MARIRYVKPDFFSDTKLSEISPLARLLYIGLWCFLDRNGLAEDDPKLLKREIFPYDDPVTQKKIATMLDELVGIGRLVRVRHESKSYIYCPNFSKHQKFHPNEKEKFAIPLEVLAAACQQPTSNLPSSINARTSSVGNGDGDWNGEQERATGTGTTSAASAAPVELQDLGTQELLDLIKPEVQKAWVETYTDPVWIKHEIKAAIAWMRANPARSPKSDFARFMNNWLTRGWERHRKSLPSNPVRRSSLDMLREGS